jgi:hypothetical protein
VRVNWAKIKRRSRDWQYALITMFGLATMLFFGLQLPGVEYGPEHSTTSVYKGLEGQIEAIANTGSYLEDSTVTEGTLDSLALTLESAADSIDALMAYASTEDWYEMTPAQQESLQSSRGWAGDVRTAAGDIQALTPDDTAALAEMASLVTAAGSGTSASVQFVRDVVEIAPFVGGLKSYMFRRFFDHIMIPIQATMFSLLAFFIASAAYRAFRARSILASVLLGSAMVLMLRLIPLGPVTNFLNDLSSWILLHPNLAAKRAILIGVGLGMVATAMKVILGIERNYLGRD